MRPFFILLLPIAVIIGSCSRYEVIGDYVDGIATAYNGRTYTYVDNNGKRINSKASFEEAYSFSEGLGLVKLRQGYYGFVDKRINVVTTDAFNSLSPFEGGFATFSLDGVKYGLIDKTMQIVLKPSYQEINKFSEGLARVKNAKYGFIDSNLKLVIPCAYSSATDFLGGMSVVQTDDSQRGIIDSTGKFFPVDGYDEITCFSNGLALVIKHDRFFSGSKHGFINRKGTLVIPCEYDEVIDAGEGLVAVCRELISDYKIWQYFDVNGHDPFNKLFRSVSPFIDGKATVIDDGVQYVLKRNGSKGDTLNMNLSGKWRHRDKELGVYTIVLKGADFELWYPDHKEASGTYSRSGNTLTLSSSEGQTYSVIINMDKQTLVWRGNNFYRD